MHTKRCQVALPLRTVISLPNFPSNEGTYIIFLTASDYSNILILPTTLRVMVSGETKRSYSWALIKFSVKLIECLAKLQSGYLNGDMFFPYSKLDIIQVCQNSNICGRYEQAITFCSMCMYNFYGYFRYCGFNSLSFIHSLLLYEHSNTIIINDIQGRRYRGEQGVTPKISLAGAWHPQNKCAVR